MYVKKPGQTKPSKSVVVFVPVQASEYERNYKDEGGAATFGDADLSEIPAGGGSTVMVVEQAKYLGSWVDRKGTDELDVERRISAASSVFGSLKCIFKSPALSRQVKAVVYLVLVMSILLYGSEAWALTGRMMQRLRSFHRRCVRTIAGINMWHVKEYKITSAIALERAGLKGIEVYVYRRQLRWIGHVSRMKWDRLPRKFLTAWCNHERPLGRPVYRWSEGAEKAIQSAGLTLENWSVAAANRAQWGALVNPERAERERLLGKRSSNNSSSNSSSNNNSSNNSSSSNRNINRNRNSSNSRRTAVDWRKPACI